MNAKPPTSDVAYFAHSAKSSDMTDDASKAE